MSEEILDLEMSLETAKGLLEELRMLANSGELYRMPLLSELEECLPEVIRFVEARRAN